MIEQTGRSARYVVRPPSARTAPEIVLRDAAPEDMPPAALSAQRLAQRAGWAVQSTYCRGWTASKGSTERLTDSVAVRCEMLIWFTPDHPRMLRAFAIYLDGAFGGGWIAGPFRRFGAVDWRRLMMEVGTALGGGPVDDPLGTLRAILFPGQTDS